MACFEERTCAECQAPFLSAKNVRYPNRRIYCKACYTAFIEKNA